MPYKELLYVFFPTVSCEKHFPINFALFIFLGHDCSIGIIYSETHFNPAGSTNRAADAEGIDRTSPQIVLQLFHLDFEVKWKFLHRFAVLLPYKLLEIEGLLGVYSCHNQNTPSPEPSPLECLG